jgi:solute carrier family 25 iron transporter 28/37
MGSFSMPSFVSNIAASYNSLSLSLSLSLIQTRMQVLATAASSSSASASTVASASLYSSNLSNILTKIWSTEGFYSLWRGVQSVVVGAGPAHALYFATYEHCKTALGVKDEDEDHKLMESGEY